jgi:NifU-like protein involved in Fe-S cluster formation
MTIGAGQKDSGLNNPLGYPAQVWRRFIETSRGGALEPATGVSAAEVGSHAGKFRLRLECRMADGRVSDARFRAWGCPYTIAVGGWLADWCIGRPVADLLTTPVEELRADLEIPEDRAHCWLMAQDVLRELHRHLT